MGFKQRQIKHLLIITTITFNLFTWMSCTPGNKGAGSLKEDAIVVDETEHLFNDDTKPACNLHIQFSFIAQSNDAHIKDSLNRIFIKQVFGEPYMYQTPQEAVQSYTTNYTKAYHSNLEPIFSEDINNTSRPETVAAWYNYEQSRKSIIERYEQNLLVYRLDTYEYTGGAHGIYGSFFTNIDLHYLRIIHLNDIFMSGYEAPLANLIWGQIKKDCKAENDEEMEALGYGIIGEVTATENFAIRKEGIEFYYNVYEIAPYASGATSVIVPYNQLKSLLRQDYQIVKEQL